MESSLRIRSARQVMGLTQADLAKRAKTTQSAVAAYENGSRKPSEHTLSRLLTAMGFKPSLLIDRRRADIIQIASRYRADNIRIFGSVARREDTSLSDIDLLVKFDRGVSLLDLVALEDELGETLGVEVDVVSEGGLRLPKHQSILDDSRPL